MELQVPPPQVPLPQPALELQATGWQVMLLQEPPSQSELALQVQLPL
jgi:hypothetical protein